VIDRRDAKAMADKLFELRDLIPCEHHGANNRHLLLQVVDVLDKIAAGAKLEMTNAH